MKLYLSSTGIPNKAAFAGLFSRTKPKIRLIANAWDVASPKIRRPFIERTHAQLAEAGASVSLCDLLKTPDISELDGMWLLGGNTFYLNWVIHQAKLPEQLKQKGESFIFGGESAGAVVAGTTLHGIEHLDDPKDAPSIIWEGLGLVPYGIVPHWGTPADQAALQKAHDTMAAYAQTKTLTDAQYIIA